MNDSVSSQWNRESYNIRSYQGSSYGPAAIDTGAGVKRSSLGGGYNDSLSSHRRF